MKILCKIRRSMCIAAFAAMVWVSGMTVCAAETRDVTGNVRYDYAYKVLELMNQQRAAVGAPPLSMDADLLNIAVLRAAETVVKFSHTRPNGRLNFSLSDKIWAENIASGFDTPEEVIDGWMSSEGHKLNMLNADYEIIGIGCLVTEKRTYWVQCFGYDDLVAVTQPENVSVTYRVAKDTSTTTTLISSGPVVEMTTEQEATTEETSEETPSVVDVSGFKVKAGKKKLMLTWKKAKGMDGYQIQISTDKYFKNKNTYTVGADKTSKTLTKYKGKSLQSGKKYYVRICTYVKNGGKLYSFWKTRSKKVK